MDILIGLSQDGNVLAWLALRLGFSLVSSI